MKFSLHHRDCVVILFFYVLQTHHDGADEMLTEGRGQVVPYYQSLLQIKNRRGTFFLMEPKSCVIVLSWSDQLLDRWSLIRPRWQTLNNIFHFQRDNRPLLLFTSMTSSTRQKLVPLHQISARVKKYPFYLRPVIKKLKIIMRSGLIMCHEVIRSQIKVEHIGGTDQLLSVW